MGEFAGKGARWLWGSLQGRGRGKLWLGGAGKGAR